MQLQTFQNKNATISELSKELSAIREEMKETSHANQMMEKRMLKAQEDFSIMQSKFESYRDIETVRNYHFALRSLLL